MTVRPLKTQFLISLRVALLLSKVVSNNVYIIICYLESRTKIHLPTRHPSGAPNDQFVEKCIIIPQVMKIYVMKAFSGVFQYCWEKKYLFLFPSKTHKKFPSQEDKIGWIPSQLQSEQPASRRTTIFYIVRQNGRGKRPQIDPSVGGRGEGNPNLTFQTFPTHAAMLQLCYGDGGGGGEHQTLIFKVAPPSYASNARKHH